MTASAQTKEAAKRARPRFDPYSDRGQPLVERFHCRYEVADDGCWNWLSTINDGGYPYINHRSAHRVGYELMVGPIPAGLVLDHLCMNKRCVNPDHLEPVTQQENVRRANEALGRRGYATHCNSGHEFTLENSVMRSGQRRCRLCLRVQNRNNMRNQRERWKAEREAAGR